MLPPPAAEHARGSIWGLVLTVGLLLSFMAIGVGRVVKPDWFMKHEGVPKGGELLTEWNRLGAQFFGILLAAGTGYGLYIILADYFSR